MHSGLKRTVFNPRWRNFCNRSCTFRPQNIPQRDLELEFDEGPKDGGGEQGRWEEARVATATLQFGAKEERERRIKEEKDKYQLVLEEDEMINFVSTAITMKGTLTEKVSA